jgi:hypothetical protein
MQEFRVVRCYPSRQAMLCPSVLTGVIMALSPTTHSLRVAQGPVLCL